VPTHLKLMALVYFNYNELALLKKKKTIMSWHNIYSRFTTFKSLTLK